MIYAVNKRTKEHRVLSDARSRMYREWTDWHVIQADDDGWIEWHGGECPLPELSVYEIKTIGGDTQQRMGASKTQWDGPRLTHYRPILTSQRPTMTTTAHEDQPEWRGPQDGLPPVGSEVMHPTGRGTVMLPPDAQDVIIVMSTNDDEYTGEYKRVAACACKPIPTPRQRWVNKATPIIGKAAAGGAVNAANAVYDALKNGDLPMPGVE